MWHNVFIPRTTRLDIGNEMYHGINRSNGRSTLFENKKDFELFEELLTIGQDIFEMRILAYTIMPWYISLPISNLVVRGMKTLCHIY